jgi:hypothetical protein
LEQRGESTPSTSSPPDKGSEPVSNEDLKTGLCRVDMIFLKTSNVHLFEKKKKSPLKGKLIFIIAEMGR